MTKFTNPICNYAIPCQRNTCFLEQVTAVIKNKGNVPMKYLNIGDEVLTSSGNYQTIYSMNHVDRNIQSLFVQIKTELSTTTTTTIATNTTNNQYQQYHHQHH